MRTEHQFWTLPNMLSLVALGCAWTAIGLALGGSFALSVAAALAGFMMDTVDGAMARRRGHSTVFGRQFDSIIDVVLYLMYPAITFTVVFRLASPLALLVTGIFVATGIFRLVRFNAEGFAVTPDTRPAYVGLPVVFGHVLVLALALLYRLPASWFRPSAIVLIVLASWLMTRTFLFPKPRRIRTLMVVLALLTAGFAWYGWLHRP